MGNGDFWKSLFGSRPAKNDSGSGGTTSTQDTTVQTGTDAKSTNAVQENGGYPLGLGTVPVGLNGNVYWDASGLYGNGSRGSSTVLPNGEEPKYTGYTYSLYGTDEADPWVSALYESYLMDDYHSDKKDENGEYAFFDDYSVNDAFNDALDGSTDFADLDTYLFLTALTDGDYDKMIVMDPFDSVYSRAIYIDDNGKAIRGNPIQDPIFRTNWRAYAHDNGYGHLYANNDINGMYAQAGNEGRPYQDAMRHVAGYDPYTGEYLETPLEDYVPADYINMPDKDIREVGPTIAQTIGIPNAEDIPYSNPSGIDLENYKKLAAEWTDAMLGNEHWDSNADNLASYGILEYTDEGAPVTYDTDMTPEAYVARYNERNRKE